MNFVNYWIHIIFCYRKARRDFSYQMLEINGKLRPSWRKCSVRIWLRVLW